jgi:hypothetical protein
MMRGLTSQIARSTPLDHFSAHPRRGQSHLFAKGFKFGRQKLSDVANGERARLRLWLISLQHVRSPLASLSTQCELKRESSSTGHRVATFTYPAPVLSFVQLDGARAQALFLPVCRPSHSDKGEQRENNASKERTKPKESASAAARLSWRQQRRHSMRRASTTAHPAPQVSTSLRATRPCREASAALLKN